MTDVRSLRDIAQGLVDAGLTDVIVCPGSRSTPLALATRAHPGLRVRVLLDERAAGFFAIGLARASRRPVAVVVTSGTAVANLLPSVIEAAHARVPLILLTADRPPELRDRGAPQTIDQVRIFGGFVRWFAELPLLDREEATRRHVRSVIGRAVATARSGPAGPVHLDIPFREPLVPDGALGPVDRSADDGSRPFTETVSGRPALSDADATDLAARLGSVERGLIVAGPQDDPDLPRALARLAATTGFPIVADPLSGVRCGPHDRASVIAHADHLIRPGPWRDAHLPELVIRFGATPTSKPLMTMLAETIPAQIVVDGDRGWSDPAIIPTTFVHADATATADRLAEMLGNAQSIATRAGPEASSGGAPGARPAAWSAASPGAWRAAWIEADQRADGVIRGCLDDFEARDEPFEGIPFALLGDVLREGGLLWAGNSMPVRDMDAFLPAGGRPMRPMSNRGANGIDGVVSTALGAAAADVGPVVLVVGDLSFLHDMNALVAARLHDLSATIVVIDNDGGGIFQFLPQASVDVPEIGLPDHYEELFGTPHGIDIGPIVGALGGRYAEVRSATMRQTLTEAIDRPGIDVLRYRTDRARNVELHRDLAAGIAVALPGS